MRSQARHFGTRPFPSVYQLPARKPNDRARASVGSSPGILRRHILNYVQAPTISQTKIMETRMNGGDAAGVPEWPLPFLRRYDPDQVQGSGSPPSQHRQVRPSAGLNAMGAWEGLSIARVQRARSSARCGSRWHSRCSTAKKAPFALRAQGAFCLSVRLHRRRDFTLLVRQRKRRSKGHPPGQISRIMPACRVHL